jgi:hypothetical protein
MVTADSGGTQVPKGYDGNLSPLSWWNDVTSRTLVLAIAALNLFVETLLNFTFEHAGSLRLVKPGYFEDLGRVEPAVCASSHYGNTVDDPAAEGESSVRQERTTRGLTFRRRGHRCMWPRSGSPQTNPDRAFCRYLTLKICTGAIVGRESNKTGYLAAQILLDGIHRQSCYCFARVDRGPCSALGSTATAAAAGQLDSDSYRDIQQGPSNTGHGYEQNGIEIAQITRNKEKHGKCVYGLKACDRNGEVNQS